jgi:hypothetical protein
MQSKVGKKWTILSELIEKFGSPFKEFSISHYVFGPKLPHYSLHVVGVKTTATNQVGCEADPSGQFRHRDRQGAA